MRGRWIALLAAVLCCCPVAVRADILQPSPIPSALADRDDLAVQRADLMAAWESLEQAIAAHNAQCSAVLEDSPQVDVCQASQAAILSDVEAYKERLQRYEDALAQTMTPLPSSSTPAVEPTTKPSALPSSEQ